MAPDATYNVLRSYPQIGPLTGPTIRTDPQARGVKVILNGTAFSAQVQVSNAAPTHGELDHLFSPAEGDWEDAGATQTAADGPLSIIAPCRFVRVKLLSGTLVAGTITEASTSGSVYGTPADARLEVAGQIQSQVAGLNTGLVSLTAALAQVPQALADNAQAVNEIRSVAGTYSLGRAPHAGDPAGTYRYADSSGTVDIAWSGTAETARTPVLATFTQTQRARNATQTVLTPEEFGAPNDFDPVYAYSLGIGTAAWSAYLASKNASLAHAKMLQYIKTNNLTSTRIQAAGRYYLGPLDGPTQRLYGRQIYGTNAALTTPSSPAQATYEQMPVVAEGLKNVEWHGLGCAYYQAERTGTSTAEPDTLLAFYQCSGIHFTGIGAMFGYAPPTATADTENAALLRFGIGTRDFSVDAGWHLGAFLGDGINIGGTRTDNGGDAPELAAYTGRITASIRERYGNGQRPWQGADGSLTPAAGANLGTKSRLAISVIHASDLKITSREIYGAIDVEPNTAAQLATDIYWTGELRAMGIVPLPTGAHPWQEEALTLPGAGGSVELEAYLAYNSPQAAQAVRGGINGKIEKGYIYLQGNMAVPITRAEFVVSGHIALGSLSGSIGTTVTNPVIQNVTAPTVYQRLLYGQTATPTTVSSLVFLSSNVRNAKITNCELADANFSVIGLNPIPNHTGGNSEQSGSYLNNRNTGLGGPGAVLGFVKHATSVTGGNLSAANPLSDPLSVFALREQAVTLDAAGKITWATTQASSYVLTPNTGSSGNFYGFTDGVNVPAGTRITVRAAAGTTIVMVSSAGIYTRTAKSFATDEYREVEFIVIGGQLVEQNRAIAGTGAVTNVDLTATLTVSNPPTQAEVTAIRDRANATATVLNSLLANLRNGGVIEP